MDCDKFTGNEIMLGVNREFFSRNTETEIRTLEKTEISAKTPKLEKVKMPKPTLISAETEPKLVFVDH